MQNKRAQDIEVGDLMLNLLGSDRLVTEIRPYEGTIFTPNEARIAYSGPGWCITLINGNTFRVAGAR